MTISNGTTGNRSYTATWSAPISYTITYTGSVSISNPASYTVETATITLNNPSKSGYTFTGWTGSNGTTPQTTVTIPKGSTGNKSYTQNWSDPISYTITYDLKGGSVSQANKSSYNVETATFTLTNPTRSGYMFKGWSGTGLSGDANTTVSIAKGSTGNRSYTANWTPISYTLTYTLNGGSVSSANPSSYTIETTTFTLYNPTRDGYTFAGWTGTGLSSATTTVSVTKGSTGNRSYTATWTENKLTIRYHLNGGTDVSGEDTFSSNDPCATQIWPYSHDGKNGSDGKYYGLINYDASRVYKTGYTADNNYYNTKANGTGNNVSYRGTDESGSYTKINSTQQIASAAGVLSNLKKGNVTIDLYMIWTVSQYTVTLNNQSATTSGATSVTARVSIAFSKPKRSTP